MHHITGKLFVSIASFCLMATVVPVANGQSIDLPQKIRDAGVISIAVDASFPPMNYTDIESGELSGASIDILRAIALKLDVEVELVETAYAQLVPGLETGRFDFIGSSFVDFPDRREALSFVDYIKTGPQLFTRADNVNTILEPVDLCGKSVAHARFVSSYPAAVTAVSDSECVAKGKPAINLVTEDLPVQIGLLQSRFDAGVVTVEAVRYIQEQEPSAYRLIGSPLRSWLYGYAFLKTDVELRDAVAKGLDQVIADGTYAEILEKYGLADLAIESAMIDAGQP